MSSENIDSTLLERGDRYGDFKSHAKVTQALKQVIYDGDSIDNLSNSQRESLEMICHKIGRIINGDPNYDDSWRDIAGYAMLVVHELNGEDM